MTDEIGFIFVLTAVRRGRGRPDEGVWAGSLVRATAGECLWEGTLQARHTGATTADQRWDTAGARPATTSRTKAEKTARVSSRWKSTLWPSSRPSSA